MNTDELRAAAKTMCRNKTDQRKPRYTIASRMASNVKVRLDAQLVDNGSVRQIGPPFRIGVGSVAVFLCRCGVVFATKTGDVKNGKSRSCGCGLPIQRVHNDSGSVEYATWCKMIGRCHNTNDASFRLYGGRGIIVCDRWRQSFQAFLEDMGRRPCGDWSIDRINNDGNYEPENCRWATKKTQNRNTRRVVRDHHGRCVRELAEKCGVVDATTAIDRIHRGWSIEDAIHKPPRTERMRRVIDSTKRRKENSRQSEWVLTLDCGCTIYRPFRKNRNGSPKFANCTLHPREALGVELRKGE